MDDPIPEAEAARDALDAERFCQGACGMAACVHAQAANDAIGALERVLRTARANYRFMVERAADEKLDGYRELASRLERAVAESDTLRSQLAAAEARTDEVIATLGPDVERLTGERDRARGMLREAREYVRHAPEVTCEWDGMVAGPVEHATIRCTCGAAEFVGRLLAEIGGDHA